MRIVGICLVLVLASRLNAEVVSCPATRDGKRLTDAAFSEWTSSSDTRTMGNDRRTLVPDESRVEGDDWYQSWNVTHSVEGNGLQMVCKYQGVKAGLFVEVHQKVTVCTLTKKFGLVTVGCK